MGPILIDGEKSRWRIVLTSGRRNTEHERRLGLAGRRCDRGWWAQESAGRFKGLAHGDCGVRLGDGNCENHGRTPRLLRGREGSGGRGRDCQVGQAGQRGAGDARREQLAGGSGEKGRGARATCVRWASALAGPERAGGGRAGQAGGGERCAGARAERERRTGPGEGEGDGLGRGEGWSGLGFILGLVFFSISNLFYF